MPNVVNVFLTLLSGLILQSTNLGKNHKRQIFLTFVWLILTFVAGTRGLYALGDTDSYYATYIESMRYTLPDYMEIVNVDYGFYLVVWLFANMGIPWQVFLILFSAFVLGTVCYWISVNSLDPLLSMLIFECLFLNIWQGSLRQALGMACLLIAYELVKSDKKLNKICAAVLFAFAFFCHSTAIVCILFLVLRKIPLTSVTIAIFSGLTISCYVFRSSFLNLINIFAESLDRNTYTTFLETNPTTLIFLCLLVLLLMIVYRTYILRYYPQAEEYYSAIFLMVAMLSLGGGVVVRLAWYFGIFLCLVFPVISNLFKPKKLAVALMIMFLLLLYLRSVDTSSWYFFWQE